jgi:hypothetical protein
VAKHELKGLMMYFSLRIPEINLPLMSLIDYRGFRLVAMCHLPVNKKTLIYGTDDGGKKIALKDPFFASKMKEASYRLNLKAHICGGIKKRAKKLHSAADVEGHCGHDGNFYLLDFSRSMPPVKPSPSHLNGHLYQLFRREFVANYPTPLCSDAYSGFIRWDPKREIHNQEIDEATNYLFQSVIPRCSRKLFEVKNTFFLFLTLTSPFY